MSVTTPEAFQECTGVSRETQDKLTLYAELLEKWQKRINLVGRSTLPDLWQRHMLDAAQLWPLLPENTETLVDFGSGAGFPGMVLAIMGVPDVHLIESDQRKMAFLREVARVTGTRLSLHNKRIESVDPFPADVITARALAPLGNLLEYAHPFATEKTLCLFLKGKQVREELTEANYIWHIKSEEVTSQTDAQGAILMIKGFEYVRETTGADHPAQ